MVPPGYKGRLAKMLTSAKITWTSYHYISIKKTWYPKLKRFFLLQTTYLHESLEGLNSPLAQSDGDLLPGEKCPQSGFWGSKILINFWFMSHIFRSRYARKSFKGSKDADIGLVSKKILSQNNGPMDWGPGPGKDGQKNKNTSTCSGPHSEP